MNIQSTLSCLDVSAMEIAKLLAVLGSIVVMVYGLNRIYVLLDRKQQGFGQNTTRVIGITLFLPILFMLSLLTGFQTVTLAALLGAVAGYVLSQSKSGDNP
jgi:hypothetical protein